MDIIVGDNNYAKIVVDKDKSTYLVNYSHVTHQLAPNNVLCVINPIDKEDQVEEFTGDAKSPSKKKSWRESYELLPSKVPSFPNKPI